MNDDEAREALLQKMLTRQMRDQTWEKWDFIIAQCLLWLAILSSFISAIVVAGDQASKMVSALLAAIPATVIVIDKSFSFARRSRWHSLMYLRLDELVNDLQFRSRPVEEVAAKLSKLRLEMEQSFPAMSTEGLSETPAKTIRRPKKSDV